MFRLLLPSLLLLVLLGRATSIFATSIPATPVLATQTLTTSPLAPSPVDSSLVASSLAAFSPDFTSPVALSGEEPHTLREGVLIFHYWSGGERLAQYLAAQVRGQAPLPALPAGTLQEGGEVAIYLASGEEHFAALAGGQAPEWSAGVALPEARVIVLPAFLSDRAPPHRLGTILRHELAHLALHTYLAPARVPRWLDEGYAQWAAGEWGREAAWKLRLAFALNRAPPLDSISLSWPVAGGDAEIAYLLALSTVAYLAEHGGGEPGLRLFLERWREGGALEPALRRTYGLTLAQFESHWLREVKQRYGWALLLTHSLLTWIPLAGLVVILTIRRRRRLRQRLEALRAEEIPDEPAYWLGGDDGGDSVEEGGSEPVR